MSHDILIVGGGIGGAVLANLLARGGKRVAVLEKNLVPPPIARPEILWPHTVQFLRTLIPEQDEHRWLLAVEGFRFFERGIPIAQMSAKTIQSAGIQPWSTAGQETRRLLLEHANCEVLRGVEVRGLLKEQGGVVGVKAHCLADGSEREWRAPGRSAMTDLVHSSAGKRAFPSPRKGLISTCSPSASIGRRTLRVARRTFS